MDESSVGLWIIAQNNLFALSHALSHCHLILFTGGKQFKHMCNMQAKWDSAVSEESPWCHSQRDTRYHQLFECTAFSDVREPFQHVLDHYQDWDPMIAELQQLVNNSERGKLEFYMCYSGCPPPNPVLMPAQSR